MRLLYRLLMVRWLFPLINIEMVLQSAAELNSRALEKKKTFLELRCYNAHCFSWLTLSSLLKNKNAKQNKKKNFNIIQHTLIDQQIADLRAQLPKKSNKSLKTILLYHGLHFSLLGCKTTTRKRTRSCILCYITPSRPAILCNYVCTCALPP